MRVESKYSDVESGGIESSSFRMELSAHAVEILTKKVYTDIPRAIVRELVFNGVDACVKARTKDPVEIYLPTENNPSLVIEDFGCGMSPREIEEVYKVFFKSSKQNNDREVGMLGLGAKTPFAYTDQYTVTTSKSGRRTTYLVFLNERGIPDISKVAEELSDRSGTRVELPVKRENFDEFYRATLKTMIFMRNLPVIKRGEEDFYSLYGRYHNIRDGNPKDAFLRENAAWKSDLVWGGMKGTPVNETMSMFGQTSYGVIMGDIYYVVDPTILNDGMKARMMYPTFHKNWREEKVVRIDIGDVDIQTSREALNYTEKTKTFLRKKFMEAYEKDLKKFSSLTKSNYNEVVGSMKSVRSFLEISEDDAKAKLGLIGDDIRSSFPGVSVWTSKRAEKPQYLQTYQWAIDSIARKDGRLDSAVTSLMTNVFFESDDPVNVIIMDQREIDKLSNRKSDKVPPTMVDRLNLTGTTGNFILTNGIGATMIKKYVPNSIQHDYESLRVPKEKTQRMTATRSGVTSHAGEDDFVFVGDTDQTISYDEVISKVRSGEYDGVVYEVYTGANVKLASGTCWNEVVDVNALKAGKTKKAEVDKVVETNRGWRSMIQARRYDLNSVLKKLNIEMEKPNFLELGVRFSQYMKLRLWEDKRFIQYTEVFKPLFVDAVSTIKDVDWKTNIRGNHYFPKEYADRIVGYSFVQGSNKFRQTGLYAKIEASANDNGTRNAGELRNDLSRVCDIVDKFRRIWGKDDPDHSVIVDTIEAAKISIRDVQKEYDTTESIEPDLEKFPMLKRIGSLQSSDIGLWRDIVDYVEVL